MKNIIVPTLTILCLIPCTSITASADEINSTSNAVVYSAGLINDYRVSITKSGTSVLMTGMTKCSETMKKVGFTSIIIQRSSDNASWKDYMSISDIIKENTAAYSLNNKTLVSVPSGYYYRITCKHYAKENGVFGSSESISNTSNSVYIS